MVYYAAASLEYEAATGKQAGFVIPTGNVGNAMAAIWVMMLGLPIREVLLATNANRVVPEYLETGVFRPTASIKTLANAMDVGNPSNLERLIGVTGRDLALRGRIRAVSVTDDADPRRHPPRPRPLRRSLVPPHRRRRPRARAAELASLDRRRHGPSG